MVYTVTFNPAIDYVVHMDEVKIGETNHSKTVKNSSGGDDYVDRRTIYHYFRNCQAK